MPDKTVRVIKIRKSWNMNPKTRVKKSRKVYSRKKQKKDIENETPLEIFGDSFK